MGKGTFGDTYVASRLLAEPSSQEVGEIYQIVLCIIAPPNPTAKPHIYIRPFYRIRREHEEKLAYRRLHRDTHFLIDENLNPEFLVVDTKRVWDQISTYRNFDKMMEAVKEMLREAFAC